MSLLTRLAPIAFIAACNGGSAKPAEPVSPAEEAVATGAVEGTVVALAPINSTNVTTIAAQYQTDYKFRQAADGGSCATVETNGVTYVQVTFACTGPLATTGTLRIEITSPTTVEATADLMIANTKIDGMAKLTIPASATTPRTYEADLVIQGPQRELDASADASWLVNGNCVTWSANGTVSVGAASKSFAITNKTSCHE